MKLINEKSIGAKLTDTPREHRITHKGMAHFAGTGPHGRTCRECIDWDAFNASYRAYDGQLTDAVCKMFSKLSRGRKGAKVPHHAEACQHFKINPSAPEKFKR
ncbi:hypothetical protein [Bradyrhizobium sp. S3.7.6]